ncbi:hypothetical protein [Kocuria aegyptia]|uniref:Uncharacterized protein n=1 Tax=Kocuria aegyptia TaxID=330943 RepID=A0ABN2KRS4_9MICC
MAHHSDAPRRSAGAARDPEAQAGAVHYLISALVFGALMVVVVVRTRGRLRLPSPGADDRHRAGGTP